jgi:5-methylcytosine-specific restriction protein B
MQMKYYCVGFHWNSRTPTDQLSRFLSNGIWENGYENKFQNAVNSVPVGSRLAAKTTYTRKEGEKVISVLEIHALGTVIKNHQDGQTLDVEWDKGFKSFTLDGRGAYRSTISQVNDPENIRLIFNNGGKSTDPLRKAALSFDPEDLSDDFPANVILYGPPGTGKTYRTINKAVAIVDRIKEEKLSKRLDNRNELKDRFDELLIENWDNPSGQIAFITFHQSINYEDFIEGIKPFVNDKDEVFYEVESGVFKKISALAQNNWLYAQRGNIENLSFEDAFNKLRDLWDEDHAIKFRMKTEGKEFTVTGFTKSSIKFKKASGGTGHTLSISTLRDYYYNRKEIRTTGVGVYYPGILDKLKSFKPEESPEKEVKNYVLIIDEINRGNISQIFGELITLIEEDKRLGKNESLSVTLPYSHETFVIPPNLYIIGTMNTADRSVEAIDTALRRRFQFEEMAPQPNLLTPKRMLWQFWWDNEKYAWEDEEYLQLEKPFYELIGFPEEKDNKRDKDVYWVPMRKQAAPNENQMNLLTEFVKTFTGINLNLLLIAINKRIEKLLGKDYMIGHAYLINIRSVEDLRTAFFHKIIPLLQEYFYGDYGRIGLVIGSLFLQIQGKNEVVFMKIKGCDISDLNENTVYHTKNEDDFQNDADLINAIKSIYEQQ